MAVISKYRTRTQEQLVETYLQEAKVFLCSCGKSNEKFGIRKALLPGSHVENATKFTKLNALDLLRNAEFLILSMRGSKNSSLKQKVEQIHVDLGEVIQEMTVRLDAILLRKTLSSKEPVSDLTPFIDVYEVLRNMMLAKVNTRLYLPNHLNYMVFKGHPNLLAQHFVTYTLQCSKRMRKAVDRMASQNKNSWHTKIYLSLQNRIEHLLQDIVNRMYEPTLLPKKMPNLINRCFLQFPGQTQNSKELGGFCCSFLSFSEMAKVGQISQFAHQAMPSLVHFLVSRVREELQKLPEVLLKDKGKRKAFAKKLERNFASWNPGNLKEFVEGQKQFSGVFLCLFTEFEECQLNKNFPIPFLKLAITQALQTRCLVKAAGSSEEDLHDIVYYLVGNQRRSESQVVTNIWGRLFS